jgi:Xaa-Pro dipeptidase
MALHFTPEEFAARRERTLAAMQADKLDALLVFAQESSYWLTGYDTFGYSFFQCLVLTADGSAVLLTRRADIRQARATSTLDDIRMWVDQTEVSPVRQLKDLLFERGLLGGRIGVEYDTAGLTAAYGRRLDDELESFARLIDASELIPTLRRVKSAAEIAVTREAARLGDLAYAAALAEIRPGADEGRILAALQGAVFEAGGDFPASDVILGSGADALLCRAKSGRRRLAERDQVTLGLAGVHRHYHAQLMRTVCVGHPTARHEELHSAALAALAAIEAVMRPGNTFGAVFDAHAQVLDERGLVAHRLNSCGYSLGARFAPNWADTPGFSRGTATEIVPDMVLFAHVVVMDGDTGTAMCLGRTYLTTAEAPEPLSAVPLDLPVKD